MPEQLIIVNSDPATGAKNRSYDGSSFEVTFETPMSVTGSPTIRILSANLWYTFPNVKSTNNTLSIQYTLSGVVNTLNIVLENGLYSLTNLNNAIERILHNNADTPDDLISFIADTATQKLDIQIKIPSGGNLSNVVVKFETSSLSSLLGFTSNVSLVSGQQRFTAQNVAVFNSVTSVLLHCSAVNGSSLNGSSSEDILAEIPLNASPGYQILYQPVTTPKVSADQFTSSVSRMRMYITDQAGNELDTNQEYWSASLLLEW